MKTYRILATVLALALTQGSVGLAQQTARELYQAGLYQEEVQGDLERAIEVYRQILDDFPDSRAVGAKAQLHIGHCYEKLGLRQAQQAYQRVIDDYPEHRDEVAIARERLASLNHALAELDRKPTFRKIEIASKPHSGVLSPDGRKLAFVSEGGVWLMPLHGNVHPDIAGAPVQIAAIDDVWDNVGQLSWSANGKWIAVNGDGVAYVIPAEGGEPRTVPMPDRGRHAYSYRLSLSPDGEILAFSALQEGQVEGPNDSEKRLIYTVSVTGGEPQPVTDMWGRLPAFSPIGEKIAYVSHRRSLGGGWESDLWLAPASGGTPVKVITSDEGRLRGPVWSPDGKFIATHFEPGQNNYSRELWVISVNAGGRSPSITKIELPRASWDMLAGWTPDNQLGVFMTTPPAAAAVFTVPASGGKAVQVTAEGMPEYLAWSPDGKRILTRWSPFLGDSVPTAQEGVIGFVPTDGGELTELPLPWGQEISMGVGLGVSPDGSKVVFMGGRPLAEGRRGPEDVSIWTASIDGGALTQLTSGPVYDAFPCWSPDGRWIAFLRLEAELDFNRGNIQLIPSSGGEIREITRNADSVAVATIAFSPDGSRIGYFSDSAIKAVPVQGGRSEVLLEVGNLGDFPDLAWSPNGGQIVYTTGQAGKVKVASLDTKRSVELATGLTPETVYSSVAWCPDGQKIGFVASWPTEDAFWLISDFMPSDRGR
jgi:Tol biopolymer transport system component